MIVMPLFQAAASVFPEDEMAPILAQLDVNYEYWADIAEREKERANSEAGADVEVKEEGDIHASAS